MVRRLGIAVLFALALAAPALVAQDAPPKAKKPPISSQPWPEEDELLARRTESQNLRLFQDGPPLAFTLTSTFDLINKERTPNKNIK
jgi:hypothetical protein